MHSFVPYGPEACDRQVADLCALRRRGVELRDKCALCDGEPKGMLRLLRRQMLYLEGDEAGWIYAVVKGTLREVRTLEDGSIHGIRLIRPGDLIGLEALHADEYRTSVESLRDAEVCKVDCDVVTQFLEGRPDLSLSLLKLVGEQVTALVDGLVMLAPSSADDRVRALINRLLSEHPPGTWVRLPMTRMEIADALGLGHTTVSRVVQRLCRNGEYDIKGRLIRRCVAAAPQ